MAEVLSQLPFPLLEADRELSRRSRSFRSLMGRALSQSRTAAASHSSLNREHTSGVMVLSISSKSAVHPRALVLRLQSGMNDPSANTVGQFCDTPFPQLIFPAHTVPGSGPLGTACLAARLTRPECVAHAPSSAAAAQAPAIS